MNDDTHARKPARVQVTCPCGTVFTAKASKIAQGQGKYCSRDCFFKARTARRSEYVSVTCPCGVEFETPSWKIAAGRGKACSRECSYRYRTRRSGLTYDIKAVNKGWFQPTPESEHRTPEEKAAYGRRWKQENPDKVRAQWIRYLPRQKLGWLRRAHGLTPEDLTALLQSQHGCCYLCGNVLTPNMEKVHVDHDHRCCPSGKSCTLCRRGLACMKCNLVAGLACDDPDLLRRIANNLEAANNALGLVGFLTWRTELSAASLQAWLASSAPTWHVRLSAVAGTSPA